MSTAPSTPRRLTADIRKLALFMGQLAEAENIEQLKDLIEYIRYFEKGPHADWPALDRYLYSRASVHRWQFSAEDSAELLAEFREGMRQARALLRCFPPRRVLENIFARVRLAGQKYEHSRLYDLRRDMGAVQARVFLPPNEPDELGLWQVPVIRWAESFGIDTESRRPEFIEYLQDGIAYTREHARKLLEAGNIAELAEWIERAPDWDPWQDISEG